MSKLGLMIDLNVRAPFAIVQKKDTYLVPRDETNLCCCISYKESDLNVSNMINESGYHQSKTFIDCLTHQPLEPLRDGPLHFFHDIHKIKQAFNLTHIVEQRLEDEEVMKVQIIFDTTKHLNLKSKVYNDVMRIKFRDHKNKVTRYLYNYKASFMGTVLIICISKPNIITGRCKTGGDY